MWHKQMFQRLAAGGIAALALSGTVGPAHAQQDTFGQMWTSPGSRLPGQGRGQLYREEMRQAPAVGTPSWGTAAAPQWGQYSNALGQYGWQPKRSIAPPVEGGSLVNPNQESSAFANSRTGATLFHPQDTRLRGRDRP
jgi:hypothetical protein